MQNQTDTPFTALPKPQFGQSCNGCGYCCTAQPCALAEEFLNCTIGPCVALEKQGEKLTCGLVRSPLAYLFKATPPEYEVPLVDDGVNAPGARELSAHLAQALGVGKGCDADDSEESAAWPAITWLQPV